MQGRLTRVEIHRKIDQRVAISLYTLFGGAVMGFYGSINSLEIDVDFQKDAVKTTNDKFDARLSAMEAKVTKVNPYSTLCCISTFNYQRPKQIIRTYKNKM
jgi:hypothetical protein